MPYYSWTPCHGRPEKSSPTDFDRMVRPPVRDARPAREIVLADGAVTSCQPFRRTVFRSLATIAGMTATVLFAPEASLEHRTPHGHPERAERFEAIKRTLEESGLAGRMERAPASAASREDLELCHDPEYIRLVEREIGAGARTLSTGDTHVGAGSLGAGRAAAGAVIKAVDAIVDGPATQAFCVLRPPGHHARPNQGMGFCIFNNVAVGARHAIRRRGLERILIADWDVHHGNGTQDIFYEDPDVLFFSTHQSPWYPGTGSASETGDGDGRNTTINCPFPAQSGRDEILGAFRARLMPAADAFRPDLVMISAGFRFQAWRSARPVPAYGRRLQRNDIAAARGGRQALARPPLCRYWRADTVSPGWPPESPPTSRL